MLYQLILLAEGEGQQQPGGLGMMAILPIIFVLFYLLILRPQRRMEQERQALVGNLKKNDEVLTTAGIYGTVVDIGEGEDKITVKVADNVRMKMTKTSIHRNLTNEEAAKEAKAAKETKT
ncbi:MAG: preprotein translocase subunit YajC [Gemmataceae bacterium]